MHYSSKHGGKASPCGYDSVVLKGDVQVISSGKKGQSVKMLESIMKNT